VREKIRKAGRKEGCCWERRRERQGRAINEGKGRGGERKRDERSDVNK